MRVYVSFDDTDIAGAPIGTGRLARMFTEKMPEECTLWGVLRHQQLVAEGIPYTSQNSSACVIVDVPDADVTDIRARLTELAVAHVLEYMSDGSDPGVCVADERDDLAALIPFGKRCTAERVTQQDAMKAASGLFLEGLGGTNDGIIGATAAIGLTVHGWCGRFIEFGNLRGFPDPAPVGLLEASGIRVLSTDRNATVPAANDTVSHNGWVRPHLWGHGPVLPVKSIAPGQWATVHTKNKH
ncbi:hypothetical protein GGQ74_002403 [Desulfobaculum xiamenense]|uniref:tRNA(Ile2) 2-agmatinylcytidine synthetase n=1 Tax=Desulfobaculum xiamenense TaxID=995050 RepID=A0A846QNY9_9BACT|nr:hypothetical protein [Desulfobaculum xiamenense]NJB68730.1 hypothetical protein [Desulfobaculum xiamenense]